MTFNDIALAYPDRVQVLFLRYGIDQPVTGDNLLSTALIYGDSFVDELTAEIEKNENFFIGAGLLAGKIKNAFSKAKDRLSKSGFKAAGRSQDEGGKGKKLLQIVSGLFGNNNIDEQIKAEDLPDKKDNTKYFIAGTVGLLLIVVLFFAFR